MWGIQRNFDTLQDGSQCYPNGVAIKALQPLPGRPLPPKPTHERPGYPNFIPGIPGLKAPRPPLGIIGGREATRIVKKSFRSKCATWCCFCQSSDSRCNTRTRVSCRPHSNAYCL